MSNEKDLERGDFELKIDPVEKKSEYNSQQSSPTLTQGSYDNENHGNGM